MATREVRAEDLRQGQVILLSHGHWDTITKAPATVGRFVVVSTQTYGSTHFPAGSMVLATDEPMPSGDEPFNPWPDDEDPPEAYWPPLDDDTNGEG